jgi:phenylpropionate dioxygenase-like ring-hydroxylating dioxygenase large terminal subunit
MKLFLSIFYLLSGTGLGLGYHLFNHWTCIGVLDKIDFSQPYVSNIGELPLVSWKHPKTNQITTTLNICKHMGSKLGNAKITEKGCLQCQYHGLEMSATDAFGETVEHEGKLFWAFEPEKKLPPKTPFYNHNDYETSVIIIDMEGSMIDCALNMMDVRHPEFVHNKLFGFGSNIPPTKLKHYQYPDPNLIGLSFEYQSSKIVKSMNDAVTLTKNFHMYRYPSFTWSKVSFLKKDLIISVNLQPLTPNKTRWYVTVCHNYYTNEIQKHVMRGLAGAILSQDYVQMKNQYEENPLKRAVVMDYTFGNEEVILDLYKMFYNTYKYPSIDECVRFYESTK